MNIKSLWAKILNIFKKDEEAVTMSASLNRSFYPQTIVFDQRDALILEDSVPASTTDKLYNNGGVLTFDTVEVAMLDGALAFVPSTTQDIVAGTGLTAAMIDRAIVRVQGSGGAVVVSATPSIAAGSDGQILIIQGDSADTVTLNDEATTAGSTLELDGDAAAVLGKGDILVLTYDAGDSKWYEISRSANS